MRSLEKYFLKKLSTNTSCEKIDNDVFYFGTLKEAKNIDFKSLLIASDSFCEDVHFKREWLSPARALQKAMLVNISDLISKGATPLFMSLNLALPKEMKNTQILQLANELERLCIKHKIKLIGGDTISSDRLEFHITLLGRASKQIPRILQKEKMLLFLTTQRMVNRSISIGQSYQNLTALLRYKNIKARSRFLTPNLREDFMHRAKGKIMCSMDISDGILQDLDKMLRHVKIAYSSRFKSIKRFQNWRLLSGEEYEVMFAIHSRHRFFIKQIAKISRISLLEIGKSVRGKYKEHYKMWH